MKIYRNDTKTLTITFRDEDGVIDITGYKVYFTVRVTSTLDGLTSTHDDSPAVITKTVTSHSDPTDGVTTVSLSASDTNLDPATYTFDVQIKDLSNNITTTQKGDFIIKSDVTRSIT